jgi:hypothetical protein
MGTLWGLGLITTILKTLAAISTILKAFAARAAIFKALAALLALTAYEALAVTVAVAALIKTGTVPAVEVKA